MVGKINKKQFVLDLIKESGAEPEEEPAAIFMAGLPGSGKTEISKNLINDSGVKFFRIDMDEIAEILPGYEPQKADEFRKPATRLLSESFNYNTISNIKIVGDEFGDRIAIDIVVKRSDNRVGWWERDMDAFEIDKKLGVEYNRGKLIEYILGT